MVNEEDEQPMDAENQQPDAENSADGVELTGAIEPDEQPVKIPTEVLHQQTVVSGLYENYFLDYASYVILERAVPAVEDGLKPVQRRILHALKEMDDWPLQ